MAEGASAVSKRRDILCWQGILSRERWRERFILLLTQLLLSCTLTDA